jgi:hypothetical protein
MAQQVHAPGVDKRKMKAKVFALQFFVATIGAVAAAWYGVASVQVSGIVSSNWVAADVIRQRCPVHLVSPGWIRGSDQGDILFSWAVTEIKARLLTVCSLWVIAIAIFAWRTLRSRHYEPTA